jgi:hypothetical protein
MSGLVTYMEDYCYGIACGRHEFHAPICWIIKGNSEALMLQPNVLGAHIPLLLNRENKEVHNIFYELLQYGSKSMHRELLTDNCISLRETHIKTKTKNLKSSTHLIEKEHTIDRFQESGAPFTQKKISKRSVEGCRSYYHQGNPHQNSHSQETAGECD